MKKFFEEYGFVILASIVLIILISICSPVGGVVKTKIDNIMLSFSGKQQSSFDSVKVHDKLGEIRFAGRDIFLDVYSDDSNAYKAIVHYTFAGKEETRTLQKLSETNDIKLPADKDTYIWIELINKETGETVKTSKEIVKQETLQYGYWEHKGSVNTLKIANFNPEHEYEYQLFFTSKGNKNESFWDYRPYDTPILTDGGNKLEKETDIYALIRNKTTGEIFGTNTAKYK